MINGLNPFTTIVIKQDQQIDQPLTYIAKIRLQLYLKSAKDTMKLNSWTIYVILINWMAANPVPMQIQMVTATSQMDKIQRKSDAKLIYRNLITAQIFIESNRLKLDHHYVRLCDHLATENKTKNGLKHVRIEYWNSNLDDK